MPTTAPATSGTGRISGIATLSPGCPGPTRIDGCPDRPYTGAIIVRLPAGTEVTRTVTGKDGRFELTLLPGRYIVSIQADSLQVRAVQAEVQVVAGQTSSIQLQGDSGLR